MEETQRIQRRNKRANRTNQEDKGRKSKFETNVGAGGGDNEYFIKRKKRNNISIHELQIKMHNQNVCSFRRFHENVLRVKIGKNRNCKKTK